MESAVQLLGASEVSFDEEERGLSTVEGPRTDAPAPPGGADRDDRLPASRNLKLKKLQLQVEQLEIRKAIGGSVVDDLTDNQRLMYTSKTYKTDDLEVKLQVTRVAVEKN